MKTNEALTSFAQALLHFRGADRIAPDLSTISRAVREALVSRGSASSAAIVPASLHSRHDHRPSSTLRRRIRTN